MLLSCTPSLQDIGGYDIQKQEIREAVELPLTHAGLYQQLGIDPPRGVLLYGPPGEVQQQRAARCCKCAATGSVVESSGCQLQHLSARAAGTGKTMLAKAVAHHTTAAFIRVVGSEFVQKYLGEVRQCSCLSSLCCSGMGLAT
jgi:26S proteasome regulatory subunit T3